VGYTPRAQGEGTIPACGTVMKCDNSHHFWRLTWKIALFILGLMIDVEADDKGVLGAVCYL